MTPARLAEIKKICACIPFADCDSGLAETEAAMRELISELELRWTNNCHCANSDECWCGKWPDGPGPFIVQETPSASGRTYYVAIDPLSGIVATGRASRGEADADRKALNAAYWLGQSHTKGAR